MSLPQTRILYTVDEYLEMERASEVRHEYLDGEIYEMAGESIAHGDICTNLTRIISTQLLGKPCRTLSKDTKVRSGWLPSPRRMMKGLFSYPDVVIVCGQPVFHDAYTDILLIPNVIIEVLSDATERFDRGEKFHRYRAHLESLTDYLLVAQNMAFIDYYAKRDDELWTLRSGEGREGSLHVASIDCTLSLAEVYDRVEFPPDINESMDEM